jgi:hypothetical protein
MKTLHKVNFESKTVLEYTVNFVTTQNGQGVRFTPAVAV